MAHADRSHLPSLHARRVEAEKALKAAQHRNLRARAALLASSGAAAVARRMVVELTQVEVQKAAAAVTAAVEAEAAADSRQIPLSAWTRAVVARRAEAARIARSDRTPSAESAEPLLAWARSHG